ncbi:MAG: VCBS repeat-containing protein, partial [Planctomycetota bacterium]
MNVQQLAKVAGPPPQIMKNALLLGAGVGRFHEAAELAGLADTDWTWSVKIADFDNDGKSDVFISNGMVRNLNDSDVKLETHMLVGRTEWELFEDKPKRPERNLAKRNLGDMRFEDVSESWGLDHTGVSYASAYGDLDRDGDLDLIVVNLDESIHIYRNDSGDGRRLLVQLRGEPSNRFGLGATLTLEAGEQKQIRFVSPFTGFLSSNDPAVHFGLGEHRRIDRLTIRWPSGQSQSFYDLATDQMLTIYESTDVVERPRSKRVDSTTNPLFRRATRSVSVRHQETPYDDFQRQPLLPNRLSQLGPGLAVSDVNGDGVEDYFIGGAARFAGSIMIGQGNGQFHRLQPACLHHDRQCEDMGAVWFDVDSDGDLDLYVVSGGVECDAGDAVLQDRVYLNEGPGEFIHADDGDVPNLRDSGSTVCAADFDRDGDL